MATTSQQEHHSVGTFCFDIPNAHVRFEPFESRIHANQQTAPTDTDENIGKLRQAFEELEPKRPISYHHE